MKTNRKATRSLVSILFARRDTMFTVAAARELWSSLRKLGYARCGEPMELAHARARVHITFLEVRGGVRVVTRDIASC